MVQNKEIISRFFKLIILVPGVNTALSIVLKESSGLDETIYNWMTVYA